jgi:hypothetical protein
MKRKNNVISKNPFIREASENHTSLRMLDSIFDDMFYNTDNELGHLKNFDYILAQLEYGDWSTAPDVFKYLNKKLLKAMKKKRMFFIFDASLEGFSPTGDYFSPTGDYSIFDYLYRSCEIRKIDPRMVIYLSGNLKDEENIKAWAERTNQRPIHVVSYLAFENFTTDTKEAKHPRTGKPLDADELYKQSVELCKKKFESRYFSSLSRVNRHERTNATFMLCDHNVSKYALISHNTLDEERIEQLKEWGKNHKFSEVSIQRWIDKLPFIVDYKNFDVNWADELPWGHIFDQTIFQLTNETLVDDLDNTSLFYSEKTFKPILKFQPFVIYGQVGCNHALKDLGYKLYDEWFDLSFDFEEDDTLRYRKLLLSINKVCKHLDTLTRQEKIEWRFKNEEILRHNYNVMKNSAYSKNKLYQFFKNLSV